MGFAICGEWSHATCGNKKHTQCSHLQSLEALCVQHVHISRELEQTDEDRDRRCAPHATTYSFAVRCFDPLLAKVSKALEVLIGYGVIG